MGMSGSFSSRVGRIGQGFRPRRCAAEKSRRMRDLPGGGLFHGLSERPAGRCLSFKIKGLIEFGRVGAPVFFLMFTGAVRLALAPSRLRPILAESEPGRVI
jgi:hypothetical protein